VQSDQIGTQQLIQQATVAHAEALAAAQQYTAIAVERLQLWRQLNWRERYLSGHFGGDKAKVLAYTRAQVAESSAAQISNDLAAQARAQEECVTAALHAHLLGEPGYQALEMHIQRVESLLETVRGFRLLVEVALQTAAGSRTYAGYGAAAGVPGLGADQYAYPEEVDQAIEQVGLGTEAFYLAAEHCATLAQEPIPRREIRLPSPSQGVSVCLDALTDLLRQVKGVGRQIDNLLVLLHDERQRLIALARSRYA
jgi:hypothetical protein